MSEALLRYDGFPGSPLERLGRACRDAGELVTETVLSGAPQPPWWPYRWARFREVVVDDAITGKPKPVGFALEVSDAAECPWQ